MATLFYNKVYSVPWTEHAVDRVRQLFSRALKYRYDKDLIDYGITVGNDFGASVTAGVKGDAKNKGSIISSSIDSPKKVVFLHGTTWHTKHWPVHYWRHLAHIAAEAGYEVLIPWGNENERQRAQSISQNNPSVTVLDKQSLSGLASYIIQSTGVIAVDTGLGHLAAALSKPTISLYGPTNPGLSGTFGDKQLHLNSDLICSPCVRKVCSYSGPGVTDEFGGQSFAVNPPCFSTHKPEAVWQQFEKLLAE
mgnify:CR=1 FL=1